MDGLRGEGRAVVGPDHIGQAVLSEGTFKQRPDQLVLGGRQALAG